MSEPTCWALCYSGADCLSSVGTYLPGTVLQWGRLFKRCLNLPAVHCVTVVKAVLAMSESTCKALCYSGKDCLRSVRTYLPGTCVAGVQAVSAMSEPTCGALCCRGADCLSSVRTYLPELCYSGAGWLSGVEPTSRALCYSGAGCLSNVITYLPGTVLQGCSLFK